MSEASKERFRQLVYLLYYKFIEYNYPMLTLKEIRFGRWVRRVGACLREKQKGECTLFFSIAAVKLLELEGGEKVAKEIILHELCHAIADADGGHGGLWKAYAEEIGEKYGVNITRLVTAEYKDKVIEAGRAVGLYRYHITCPCGYVDFWKARKDSLIKRAAHCSCRKCGNPIIVAKLNEAK